LQKRGFIQPSFIDAEDAPPRPPPRGDKNTANKRTEEQGGALAASQSAPTNRTGTKAPLAHGVESASPSAPPPAKPQAAPRPLGLRTILHILVGTVTAAAIANIPGVRGTTEDSQNVAYSTEHGVRPRKEILWELLFLLPPILLASAASLLLGHVPAAAGAWNRLFDYHLHPQLAPHLEGLGSAIFGYVIGGLWVWATRILGTLAFNKEAMGMGDVHILAAVGAVTGWIVPSLTFFITPFIGLGWALYVWIGRKQSVIAYGPLLATGCLAVMLFYDPILRRIDLLLYAGH